MPSNQRVKCVYVCHMMRVLIHASRFQLLCQIITCGWNDTRLIRDCFMHASPPTVVVVHNVKLSSRVGRRVLGIAPHDLNALTGQQKWCVVLMCVCVVHMPFHQATSRCGLPSHDASDAPLQPGPRTSRTIASLELLMHACMPVGGQCRRVQAMCDAKAGAQLTRLERRSENKGPSWTPSPAFIFKEKRQPVCACMTSFTF